MKRIAIILTAIIFFVACKKDDEQGSVKVTFKGVNTTLKNASANDIKITDFKLSFRDVEFKLDESNLNAEEVQFRGSYDVDLMSSTNALSQTIGNIDVADGTYKVLRFKMHKSTVSFMTVRYIWKGQ
jgi:PBP1b-binding outer membrane lipoprotein LpoB